MHFHQLFEIETDLFSGDAPRPDAINELIGGDELAAWLYKRLVAKGIICHAPYAEDHGWDFEVRSDRRRYLVVCSCEFADDGVPADRHFVQVARTKGEANEPDPVLVSVREVLTNEQAIQILADEPKRRC